MTAQGERIVILADAETQGVTRIVVAGASVGFGPQANAAVDVRGERGAARVRRAHASADDTLVNVGSVGTPLDGDPRCLATYPQKL